MHCMTTRDNYSHKKQQPVRGLCEGSHNDLLQVQCITSFCFIIIGPPTQSVEIKKFWRNVPETDTSRPINIPHYTFKTTSINTRKTLLDKTKFNQRDVWHTLQWQYTLNIGTCRCWKSSIKSNSCFAINDLSYWLSLSSECLLSLLHRHFYIRYTWQGVHSLCSVNYAPWQRPGPQTLPIYNGFTEMTMPWSGGSAVQSWQIRFPRLCFTRNWI